VPKRIINTPQEGDEALNADWFADVADMLNGVAGHRQGGKAGTFDGLEERMQPLQIVECILEGELDLASSTGKEEQSATARVQNGYLGEWGDADQITVVNRSDYFCASEGDWIMAALLPSGEWRAFPRMDIVEGYLDTALAAATGSSASGQDETTGTMTVWRHSGGSWAAGTTLTVTNRRVDQNWGVGDYVMAAYINCEWRPISSGGAGGDNCEHVYKARCTGSVLENCLYFECYSPTHAVTQSTFLGCGTDSSTSGTGGVEVSFCAQNLPSNLYISLSDTTTPGADCPCAGAAVVVAMTWNGAGWSGSTAFGSCTSQNITCTLTDNGSAPVLTLDFSGDCVLSKQVNGQTDGWSIGCNPFTATTGNAIAISDNACCDGAAAPNFILMDGIQETPF